jgi:ATP synthase protein I
VKLGEYVNKRLNKHGIIRFWLFQLTLVVLVAMICVLEFNAKAAYSAVLGGLVAIIPNAFFAAKLFKYQGARAARQIVSSFYKGEALKIILSMLLFTLVFVFCKITPLAFFASYVLVLMTHWFAPWIIVNKRK